MPAAGAEACRLLAAVASPLAVLHTLLALFPAYQRMLAVSSDVTAPIQDRNFPKGPKSQDDIKTMKQEWFQPGSRAIDDPRRQQSQRKEYKAVQHVNVIYPRRNLATLIATCYPVIDGTVVMHYKPVFTTAGAQPYAGVLCSGPAVVVTCSTHALFTLQSRTRTHP